MWNIANPLLCSSILWNLHRSVGLHSSLSLFVFLQTAIGCRVASDAWNRRGKSRGNAVQPLCLSYSLILLTLSLCCARPDIPVQFNTGRSALQSGSISEITAASVWHEEQMNQIHILLIHLAHWDELASEGRSRSHRKGCFLLNPHSSAVVPSVRL